MKVNEQIIRHCIHCIYCLREGYKCTLREKAQKELEEFKERNTDLLKEYYGEVPDMWIAGCYDYVVDVRGFYAMRTATFCKSNIEGVFAEELPINIE